MALDRFGIIALDRSGAIALERAGAIALDRSGALAGRPSNTRWVLADPASVSGWERFACAERISIPMDADLAGSPLYVPPHFAAHDVREVQAFVRRVGICTLVTFGTEIDASLIPIVLHPDEGPFGTLRGHFARPNRQLERRHTEVRALAVFQGPAHYITPSWYETKRRTAKVVPTYDYAIAQARGFVRIIEDPDRVREHLAQLTAAHEATVAGDWHITDAPHDYIDTMMKGIIAFELRIDELVGKWKLSQNRPADDIDGVVGGLSALDTDAARSVAKLVEDARPG